MDINYIRNITLLLKFLAIMSNTLSTNHWAFYITTAMGVSQAYYYAVSSKYFGRLKYVFLYVEKVPISDVLAFVEQELIVDIDLKNFDG
jgi:hypothetical protein